MSLIKKVRQYQIKCVYLHPKIDASSRAMRRKHLLRGPPIEFRQNINSRTLILMPFCFAFYVLVVPTATYWGHRIRFKSVLFEKGVWRHPIGVELKQHEFYAFLCSVIANRWELREAQ